MKTFRSSKLWLNLICGESAVAPVIGVRTDSEPARSGTAIHKAITSRVAGVEPDVYAIAAEHGLEEEEFANDVGMIWSNWLAVRDQFPDQMTEVGMEWYDERRRILLTGRADIISERSRKEIGILDLKTGRLEDVDVRPQLKAYGWLALQNSDAESIYAGVLRPRAKENFEFWRWSRAELAQWWEETAAKLSKPNPGYNAGPHCRYCPRWHECPGATSLVQSTKEKFLDQTFLTGEMTAADWVDVVGMARMLERAAEDAIDLAKTAVAAAGGEMALPDGRRLTLTQVEMKKIQFGPGEAILREALGDRLAEAVTVGKSRAEGIVRDGVGRGQKKAAVEEFMARLEEAGAVVRTTQTRLEVKHGDATGKPAITSSTNDPG